jgi:hypothetical protein
MVHGDTDVGGLRAGNPCPNRQFSRRAGQFSTATLQLAIVNGRDPGIHDVSPHEAVGTSRAILDR